MVIQARLLKTFLNITHRILKGDSGGPLVRRRLSDGRYTIYGEYLRFQKQYLQKNPLIALIWTLDSYVLELVAEIPNW